MKKLYKICLFSLSGILFLLLFTNASTGPGFNFNTGYTGAPFDGGAYCSSCHSGGNFTPVVSIQLLNQSNQPVTSYQTGASYTVRLTLSTTTGLTIDTRYGFQLVAVQSPSSLNSGTWGTLNMDHHSVVIGGRTYVEHSDRLTTNTIDVPWNAPTSGSATVTFYAAGNIVDMSFDPTGDNPNIANLVVPAINLPVSWLYFRGKNDKNKIVLEWGTTDELNNGHFLLEKSGDGEKYTTLAKVDAARDPKPTEEYSFTDTAPLNDNYYRISQVDLNGIKSTFRTIRLQGEGKSLGLAYVKGNNVVVMLSDQKAQQITAEVFSIDGRKVSSMPINLSAGTNTLNLEKPAQNGIYLISVKSFKDEIFSSKVLVE